MATVEEQIRSSDRAICGNIEALAEQRDLLSQNLLAQLRNLIEGVALCLDAGSLDVEFTYAAAKAALGRVSSQAALKSVTRFHRLVQTSASHYSLDGDASERLMLKYYEYLLRIRALVHDRCGMKILANLETFPIDLDPALHDYHEKIAARIETARQVRLTGTESRRRYYIHAKRPFFVNGRIYYEVTFNRAINKVNKFDRIIAFTHLDLDDEYSAELTLTRDSIEVLGHSMPITIIRGWQVSVRPCEFKNFARIFGQRPNVSQGGDEYVRLMRWLTTNSANLLDIVDLSDPSYAALRSWATDGTRADIFPVLDTARDLIRSGRSGHNLIRYLLLRMHNEHIKSQYSSQTCSRLSNLWLSYGCMPFEEMPFCSSPIGHVPRYWDVVQSIGLEGRNDELLARKVKANVEQVGILYTPVTDLEHLGDVASLAASYNRKLYPKHRQKRELVLDGDHIFLREYEDTAVAIISRLQEYTTTGVDGHAAAVAHWLSERDRQITDPLKRDALLALFTQSRAALVYGAAGTGKSTMVDHIANYFNDKRKLFLAHTNPAVTNLKRRVSAQNSEFSTIRKHTRHTSDYDLVVIDECSTVSNADLLAVLTRTSSALLVLVGDDYQIESIQFGNWFDISRAFIPAASVFELTTPWRTKNEQLLKFWDKVRTIAPDIAENMARNGYSTALDASLFDTRQGDEIILCLTYDGLYGINNVNRFLQGSNPNPPFEWGIATYKVGDPVLFYDTQRFGTVVYNNLKGRIVNIARGSEQIHFDVQLDRAITELDIDSSELTWLGNATVRFTVYDRDISDDDDDSLNTTVPFQVAYAVSIHKAQGLEYDSVKIVITDANEASITHSIFYTAVTRAREQLQVLWSPETQHAVLSNLKRNDSPKDVQLLSNRRGLTPVAPRRRRAHP